MRTGTFEVMTCLRSAFSLSSEVEFRAVAGQVEQLDFLGVLGSPSLYRFAVMNSQVVQYQKHFAVCILDERLQKFNELVGVKGLINNHPARFTLVGYRRNHR